MGPVSTLHRSTPAELAARRAAERGGAPFVLLRDGGGEQRILTLDDGRTTVTIGRQAASDLALTWDAEVSRAHAAVERIGAVWTLVDDGRSRNGSFVNGDRVHGRRSLRDGDVIVVGGTAITFCSPLAAGDGSTAAAGRKVPLSPAQRRVLVALCRPFAESRFAAPPANRELAAELCLSVETIRYHLAALFGLFGLDELPQHRKRVALAQAALECGAVSHAELLAG